VNFKVAGWTALALVVALAGGWTLGASGRSAFVQERRAAEDRALFAEARALALDGRVSLFLVNFGDASTRFEEAHAVVERLQAAMRETGQAERAGGLEIVLAQLRDAQRLSAALDQSAQHSAAEALKALDAAR
jgi:hypothetical protein